jgi:hypothetical protein
MNAAMRADMKMVARCSGFSAVQQGSILDKQTTLRETIPRENGRRGMRFEAKSQQELNESRLLPKGDYDFEIVDAWETHSTAGNEMIELEVRISDGNGLSRKLADYLVPKRPEKLRHCAAACGVLDRYEAGEVSESDFKGKRGRLKLGVERAKRGFPPRNIIQDYVVG